MIASADHPGEFLGYPRRDGRAGTRNVIAVIPSTGDASGVVAQVQRLRPDACCVVHQAGAAGPLADLERETLAGFASNPNVAASIFVGLGDPDDPMAALADATRARGGQACAVGLIGEGGWDAAVARTVEVYDRAAAGAQDAVRRPVPIASLVLGTECGGSDAFSGISANPVLGRAADRLVEAGATVVLAEVTELIGAEHLLIERAASPDVARELRELIARWEAFALRFGEDLGGDNISAGNMAGGLTTIEEKSLGCVYKGGSTPVVEVVGYGQRPRRRGLVVMDTDGHDISELTALAAGGANVIVFTTGRGTPTASPIVPTVKVASTTPMAERLSTMIDFDAGSVLSGVESLAAAGDRLCDLVVAVAGGRHTAAELLGQRDFALPPLVSSVAQ